MTTKMWAGLANSTSTMVKTLIKIANLMGIPQSKDMEVPELCDAILAHLEPKDPKFRATIVPTAQIWYDAAKNPTADCSVEIALHNAFNHTQNALVGVLENPDSDYTKSLQQRLKDLKGRK